MWDIIMEVTQGVSLRLHYLLCMAAITVKSASQLPHKEKIYDNVVSVDDMDVTSFDANVACECLVSRTQT